MEFDYIGAVDAQAERIPDGIAFRNSRGESITYGELKRRSDALACWIAGNAAIPAGAPIVVYGHKAPDMLVCFFACVKSGHAYVPIDVMYPRERVANIIEQLGETAALDTVGTLPELVSTLPCPWFATASIDFANLPIPQAADMPQRVGREDAFYILFTSGSTGTPKGVEIIRECVDQFSGWFCSNEYFADEPGHRVWFNRAPFTFDLSVTDLCGALARGDTMFALEAEAEQSLALMFEALAANDITDWVSTPSVLDQCLADESFNPDLLPHLKRTLHVGETLRPETVRIAMQRFPGLRIYNGYGPTESTDFVSICEMTPAMLEQDRSLPVGYAREGSELLVLDPETLEPVPDGTHGELFIVGDTVARGYWRREEQTAAAFHSCPEALTRGRRSYRTGDEMTRDADGQYYYHGRYDLQIKLHGYRIELGDIEATLCALDAVNAACVVPVIRDGVISHLVAFVVPADLEAPRGFALTKQLKREMRESVPTYMVPRAFKYADELPLNPNGKADRKALAALVNEGA